MPRNILIRLINLLCFALVVYFIIFLFLRFIFFDIGELNLKVTSTPSTLDSRMISIEIPNSVDDYYLLIYEDDTDENWLYFNTLSQTTLPISVLELFLPAEQPHYVLLQGDSSNNTFHFSISSKYPLTYMATKEHIFHIHYIVPFKIFPFPPFYYSKYYTFFIDPLI